MNFIYFPRAFLNVSKILVQFVFRSICACFLGMFSGCIFWLFFEGFFETLIVHSVSIPIFGPIFADEDTEGIDE